MFDLAKILKNTKKGVDTEEKDSALLLVDGFVAFESGRYEDAAELFHAIIETEENHPIAWLMLGRSLIELKQYPEAIEALARHMDIAPTSVEGLIHLGLAYYDMDEHEDAIECFEEATRLKKDSILARENLAIAHIETGDLDDAIEELIALHEEDPTDREIVELIILTFGKLGKWEVAKQYSAKMGSASSGRELE